MPVLSKIGSRQVKVFERRLSLVVTSMAEDAITYMSWGDLAGKELRLIKCLMYGFD
jgi:hypothetical protein